jgi:hypothetical protein
VPSGDPSWAAPGDKPAPSYSQRCNVRDVNERENDKTYTRDFGAFAGDQVLCLAQGIECIANAAITHAALQTRGSENSARERERDGKHKP